MADLNTVTHSTVVQITDLSHEGRGIAHIDGKTTFIDNALPGEMVSIQYTKRRHQYDEARSVAILNSSPDRLVPRCPHYGVCGGCSLQHLSQDAQLRHKEKVLLEQLAHIARIIPRKVLPPLSATGWGYRRRARLGVKYVAKKQAVLVGFREKSGHRLAQLEYCETLDAKVAQLLVPLQRLLSSLEAFQVIPQIEVALGDEVSALVFRHLKALSAADEAMLKDFARHWQIQLYLQPGNESTLHCIWPETAPKPLRYRLHLDGVHPRPLELFFEPVHFIQVNAAINQSMVSCALEWLALGPSDQVLDLFCGIGNFSLAVATQCRSVVGVDWLPGLVAQARENAMHNEISNVQFCTADLGTSVGAGDYSNKVFTKLLLDPPRSGALEIVQRLPLSHVERIVYVSCNPSTLARDAGELAKRGYSLQQVGIADMFPHTCHSETICLFTK